MPTSTYGPLSLFVRSSLSAPSPIPQIPTPRPTPSPPSRLGASASAAIILLVILSVLIALMVILGLFWRQLKIHTVAMRELEKAEKLRNRTNKPTIWEVWVPRELCRVQTKWENMQPLWVQGSSLSSHIHMCEHGVIEKLAVHTRPRRRWFSTRPRTDRTVFQTIAVPHPQPQVEVAVLIVMPSPVRIDKSKLNLDTGVLDTGKGSGERLGEHMIGITYMFCRPRDKTIAVSV